MNTIVFVEDDAEVGSLIAAYLAKHDMQVTVEPRGDQAEETILREIRIGVTRHHATRQGRHDHLS